MSELKYKPGVLIIEGSFEIEGFYGKEKQKEIYACLDSIYGNFNMPVVLQIYVKDKSFKILTAEEIVCTEDNDVVFNVSFYAQGFLSAHGIVYKENQ